MARLGAANLAATTDTTLYTVPANTRAALTVNLCNRGPTPAKVRVALTNGGALSNADYLEYDVELGVSGVLERSGVLLTAGQVLIVRTDVASVSAVVWGVEESI